MTTLTLKPTVYSLPPYLKPPASILKPVLVLNRNWQPIYNRLEAVGLRL